MYESRPLVAIFTAEAITPRKSGGRDDLRTRKTYTVVENAGYEGECDGPHFTTFAAAAQWVNRKYSGAEMVALHVAIACDSDKGQDDVRSLIVKRRAPKFRASACNISAA